MRKKLPIITPRDESLLDRIGVATPCEADWDSMKGDDRVRHCPSCRLNVYDISAMTRPEAVRLIREREGRLCVRLYRREDGRLLTADCWEKLRAARRRGLLAFAAAVFVIGFAQIAMRMVGVYALFAGSPSLTSTRMPVMGEAAAPGDESLMTLGRMAITEPVGPPRGAPATAKSTVAVAPNPTAKPTRPATPKVAKPSKNGRKMMGKMAMPREFLMGEVSIDD